MVMTSKNMFSSKSETGASCCSTGSAHGLKLYQAFIFTIPIILTFVLILLFYFFYLRPRRVDWSSLRQRAASLHTREQQHYDDDNDISGCELGLKKEHREMLPIIVFNESFSVKDTQCPVCLADYQTEDRLQQIPACGHTFHMDCIDLWLATHTTCPLCRLSLVPSPKPSSDLSGSPETSSYIFSPHENSDETSLQDFSLSRNGETIIETSNKEGAQSSI